MKIVKKKYKKKFSALNYNPLSWNQPRFM